MSAGSRRDKDDSVRYPNTLDIDDFEPVSNGQPEEFEPGSSGFESDESRFDYPDESHSFTGRFLTVMTSVLSVLLIAGSALFWWYFVRRLTVCPASVNNRELYPAMLASCAAFSLAVTVGQFMRRRSYPSPESWMINICVSGAVTSVVMMIYNSVVLGNVFEWGDVLPTLCFSVTGCALPAALFAIVWALVLALIDHIRFENSKDSEAVYASVRAQCNGRFF